MLTEINLDGLVGPTHCFGGLGVGNVASHANAGNKSFPKLGALQGLKKMWRLVERGIPQGVLPPCLRPNPMLLASHGFSNDWNRAIQDAAIEEPSLLSASYSSAFMWAANCATFSPTLDSLDSHSHLTVANLASNLHRSQEGVDRLWMLRQAFQEVPSIQVHAPLLSCTPMRDEGAANHVRLSGHPQRPGIQIFVHGPITDQLGGNSLFAARQSGLASRAIARLHRLDPQNTFFLQQNPVAIDAGVFHNDVIATGHEDVLIYHQHAFLESETILQAIEDRFQACCGGRLHRIEISDNQLPLKEAVTCYLFNSQFVTLPECRDSSKRMLLLAPVQCQKNDKAYSLIQAWIADPSNPIAEVEFVELDQSMANGGGPACLRLRLQLTESQRASAKPSLWLDRPLRDWLEEWITRHYPEELCFSDLTNPDLAKDAWRTVLEFYKKWGWHPPEDTFD